MTRNFYSSYYKGVLADEDLYQKLKPLSYNDKEFLV